MAAKMAEAHVKGLSKKGRKRYKQMYDSYVTSMVVLAQQIDSKKSRVASVQHNDPFKRRTYAPKFNKTGNKDNNYVRMSTRNWEGRLENLKSSQKDKIFTEIEVSEKLGTRSTEKIDSFQKTKDKTVEDKPEEEELTQMSNLKTELEIVENKLKETCSLEKSKVQPTKDNELEERSTLPKENCLHGETTYKTVKENDSFQAIEMKKTSRKSEIELIDESEHLLEKTKPESEVDKDVSTAEAESLEETDNKENYFGNLQFEDNSTFSETKSKFPGLKDISMKTEIPNNSLARLMYYLDCVCIVLRYENNEVKRLRDYRNYMLTEMETDKLVSLCYHLSPDVLLNKVFFRDQEMFSDVTNRFCELSEAQTYFVDSIRVGKQILEVKKIMYCTKGWIDRNWFRPIKNIVEQRTKQRVSRTARSIMCLIM